MRNIFRPISTFIVLLLFLTSCTNSKDISNIPNKDLETQAVSYDLDIPMVNYHWDPSAGDQKVPANLGGPGFTGKGWKSNMRFLALGSTQAVKGGTMIRAIPDWPATLRQAGKDWNTSLNYLIRELCYEPLLNVHPTTLEFIPGLATHWWISKDKMTYRFRINPKARWHNGTEITAEDVVASYDLRMDPTLLDPSNILTFGKLYRPKAISKYIVEVKVKEENWRNFLYFSGTTIFPAADISISGSKYLDKYQFSFTANSGPYRVHPEDIDSGKSIMVKRRSDWWDVDNPSWVGLWNIDTFKFNVVMDPGLAFEKIKKGELDYFWVPKAQWWVEELDNLDSVQRGLLLKRKFFTDSPVGVSGIAINMKNPPLDDINVRRALGYLHDRKTLIEKLFFNEYKPLNSYYQGGTYQNPNNVPIEYDELKAVALLERSGWTKLNNQGYRVKNGRELRLTLIYRSPLSERSLTVFQESCKKAGIRIELQRLTPAASWKNLRQKQYQLMSVAWGALIFPNPETAFHSSLALQKDNNNVTGLNNSLVDKLCEAYDKEYDVKKRIQIIREIDGIIYNQHPYVLGWYGASQRVIFWNKFNMPHWGRGRTDDYNSLLFSWWIDPEKENRLKRAKKDRSINLSKGIVENHFWKAWTKNQLKE